MTVTVDLAALSADVHARRTLSDISLSIAKGKRIVVVTGAGISCSCGIPVHAFLYLFFTLFDMSARTFVRQTASTHS